MSAEIGIARAQERAVVLLNPSLIGRGIDIRIIVGEEEKILDERKIKGREKEARDVKSRKRAPISRVSRVGRILVHRWGIE